MNRLALKQLWQSSIYFLCLCVALMRLDEFGAWEFSGGRVTGPVYEMFEIATVAFLVAMVVSLASRRIGAGVATLAALLSLPLYIYFFAPGFYRSCFREPWSTPLIFYFRWWDAWPIAGLLSVGVAVSVSVRALIAPFAPRQTPHSETSRQ